MRPPPPSIPRLPRNHLFLQMHPKVLVCRCFLSWLIPCFSAFVAPANQQTAHSQQQHTPLERLKHKRLVSRVLYTHSWIRKHLSLSIDKPNTDFEIDPNIPQPPPIPPPPKIQKTSDDPNHRGKHLLTPASSSGSGSAPYTAFSPSVLDPCSLT